MIQSFRCRDTQALFERKRVPRFVNIERVARRKLEQLEWAERIKDLRIPPQNRLEALKGSRKGQWSTASTTSGVCAFVLKLDRRWMWKLSIITEELVR